MNLIAYDLLNIPDIRPYMRQLEYLDNVLHLPREEVSTGNGSTELELETEGCMSESKLQDSKTVDEAESGLCNWCPSSEYQSKFGSESLLIPKAVIQNFIKTCQKHVKQDAEDSVERMALLFGHCLDAAPSSSQQSTWEVTHMYFPVTKGTDSSVQAGDDEEDNIKMATWQSDHNLSILGWIHVSIYLYKSDFINFFHSHILNGICF